MLFFFTFFIDESSEGFPVEEDTHYLFFQMGNRFLIIPETQYVIILIAVLGILLLYPFFARRRFRRYFHMMRRHLWILPVMVTIIFLFLFLGTLTVNALLALKGDPQLWHTNPIPFYLLKISGALLCYVLTFRLFKKFHFSRKGNFYSAAALLLLLLDLVIISFINISFSYYILWSFLFAFLLSTFRHRSLKVACLFFSMIWLFKYLFDIFTFPQEELIQILLLSRVKGNLLQALVLLPFIFLMIRLSFLFFIPKKAVRKAISLSILVFLSGSCGVLLIYLGTYDPYRGATPQPVAVRDNVFPEEGMRSIAVTSPAPSP